MPAQHQTTAAAPTPTGTAQTLNLDAQNMSAIWAQVIDSIGDISSDFARGYKSLAISKPNQLVVTMSSAYNKEECERGTRKKRFEDELSKAAGQPMKIEFRVDPTHAVAKSTEPKKNKRQLIREVEQVPIVSEALKTFDGEVTELISPRES